MHHQLHEQQRSRTHLSVFAMGRNHRSCRTASLKHICTDLQLKRLRRIEGPPACGRRPTFVRAKKSVVVQDLMAQCEKENCRPRLSVRAVPGVGAALFGLPLVPPPLLWPHKTKWRLVVSPPFGTEGKEGGLEVHYRGKGGVKERDPVSVLGFSRIISNLKAS
ncbi:uncharacterized [Tachysurus ichikawai]